MTLRNKLGRKPRSFSPHVMHLSAIFAACYLPLPPVTVDWTKGLTKWGMMLNDTLGDCTCAAAFHARQVWTANTGTEDSPPDADVLQLYEQACGYIAGDSSTDQGGNEQTVLTYLMKKGYPDIGDKLTAFFEVDPRNTNDVKTVINQCGICYIGFNVPENIDETPGAIWGTVDPNATIEGGHAVVLVGYDADTVTLISWGTLYKMTWEFFQYYTDEAYAIISPNWTVDGKTPLGLSPAQLESMMKGLK